MASTAIVTKTYPCSLCKDYPMVIPIYQCYEGHPICKNCEDNRVDCPECHSLLPKSKKINCRVLEHLQPKIKCAMRQCSRLFTTVKLMQAHRLLDCDYLDVPICKWTGVDSSCRQQFAPYEGFRAARHLVKSHKSNAIAYNFFNTSDDGDPPSYAYQEFMNPVEGIPKFIFGMFHNRFVLIKIEVKYGRRKLTPFILASRVQSVTFKLNMKIELRIKERNLGKTESVASENEHYVTTAHSGPFVQIAETGDVILDLYVIDGSSVLMNADHVDMVITKF